MARLDLFVRRCGWQAGIAFVLTCMCWASAGIAQEAPASGDAAGKKAVQSEEGFPVTNPQVIASCSGCHARDAKVPQHEQHLTHIQTLCREHERELCVHIAQERDRKQGIGGGTGREQRAKDGG